MRFAPTSIDGVLVLELEARGDERGSFMRTFCANEFAAAGIDFTVVQANVSVNVERHTLRGMHLQRAPYGEAKIVSCLRGRIFDVAVDLRPESPTYLKWEGVELGADIPRAFYLAEGIAHGFLTLEPDSLVNYLMGAEYVADAATGVRWDDPVVGIEWPAPPQVISDRDRAFPLIQA